MFLNTSSESFLVVIFNRLDIENFPRFPIEVDLVTKVV
jgi:hypothetical protein